MASESKLPIIIFAGLVVLISLPFVLRSIVEARRPVVIEARVVTATSSDPVFRDGPRRVVSSETIQAALALRIKKSGETAFWLAPVSRLAIDSQLVEHVESDEWPDEGRELRVFWFSVESSNLGGRMTSENAAEVLRYRTFLAQEMGRGLLAKRLPEPHHDDHLGEEAGTEIPDFGTTRLYGRVEIVEKAKDIKSQQMVATLGVDDLDSPRFPTIVRSHGFDGAVDPAAGELFRLPGFEPAEDSRGSWDTDPLEAFGRTFSDLVDLRLATSSRTFAAVAATGMPDFDLHQMTPIADLAVSDEDILSRRRPLAWGEDVQAGDIIACGDRWIVVLADNGNGVLDPLDSVLHCWGRPPQRTTLSMALPPQMPAATLYRHE